MVVLATPTRDSITAGTAGDIVALCRQRPDVTFCAPLGIYIGMLREQAVTLALGAGASHILFIDADMRFPPDTLDRLHAHGKMIACANYVQRTMPAWWVSRTVEGPVSSQGKRGLERVETTGCGVMLIDLHVFDWLPKPWFATPYENGVHVGEDVYFCEKARAQGFTPWIDHDLSQQVRHQRMEELGVHSMQALAVV